MLVAAVLRSISMPWSLIAVGPSLLRRCVALSDIRMIDTRNRQSTNSTVSPFYFLLGLHTVSVRAFRFGRLVCL